MPLAVGWVRSFDECNPGVAPTGPTRTRRIDFGLAHHRLWADQTANHEHPEVSNHALVSYDISGTEGYIHRTFGAPAFQALTAEDPEAIQLSFEQHWSEHDFRSLLDAGDVDAAWDMLSGIGEVALRGDVQVEGPPRASCWDPVPAQGPHGKAGAHGHESGHLRLLRRLRGQLHQLRAQPHCPLRWRRALRSVASLRSFRPDLPYIDIHRHEENVAWIDDLYAHQANLEKWAHLKRWQEDTAASQKQTFSWIKRSANVAWKLEQPSPAADNPPRAVHPARILEQQSQIWRDKWAPPEHPCSLDALDGLLAVLPEREEYSADIAFSPGGLRKVTQSMMGKSPGPMDARDVAASAGAVVGSSGKALDTDLAPGENTAGVAQIHHCSPGKA